MPPSFLSNIAGKAQAAVNASPLAGHLPASLQRAASSTNPATQPSENQAVAQGGTKNHTLETIHHQFRSLQQQYISNASPAQKIVTSEKGVVIDFDSVSRDSKAQSKELYTWGQLEAEDLKDITDHLANLNFVLGSLAGSLSTKLDSARGPFKALRNAEAALLPRRNTRASLQTQITKLEQESPKAGDKRIAELREQLYKHEQEDQQQEKELEPIKRKAVRESEMIKWEAIREFGEKLVLLSQAATPIIDVLPSLPPTQTSPYTGTQATGAVRVSLQRALDDYKTGHINLPQVSASDLSHSNTRSFGESYASDMARLSNGSLPAYRQAPPPVAVVAPASQEESASEERRRQAVAYSEQYASSQAQQAPVPTNPPPAFPSAGAGQQTQRHETAEEEEKKRLEREEHERTLHAGGSGPAAPEHSEPDDDDWPVYE